MSINRDPAILIDIANACQLLSDFVKGRSRDDLDSDMLLQSAVLHQLLILGEAVRRLSGDFRAVHPEIDWRGYVGQRNVLIHQYDLVDLDEIWKVVSLEVPDLYRQIQPDLPDDEP
jgi:uncharacterized protein with HEPN domain